MNPGESVTVKVRILNDEAHRWNGLTRRAYITSDPDTFFSQPARVSLDGKKVAGFLTGDGEGGLNFIPYLRNINIQPDPMAGRDGAFY